MSNEYNSNKFVVVIGLLASVRDVLPETLRKNINGLTHMAKTAAAS